MNTEIGSLEISNLSDQQIAVLRQLTYTAEDGYDDSAHYWTSRIEHVDDELVEDCRQYAKEDLGRANQCHVLQNRLREEQRKRQARYEVKA
jgi:hypothetical protein